MDPGADAGPERERYVVDGLALVRTVLDWVDGRPALGRPGRYRSCRRQLRRLSLGPAGLRGAAGSPIDKVDGLLRAIDELANAVDALADLTTAEAVHQIVRGNHPRAAAVLPAMAEGIAPPAAEIAESPRTGLPVTHRVVLQVPALPADPAAPPSWTAVPRPRARRRAVAGRLARRAARRSDDHPGAPGPPPGATSGPLRSHAPPEVSVAELGLRPLDLLAIVGPGYEAGVGDLVARVLDARRPNTIEPDPASRVRRRADLRETPT